MNKYTKYYYFLAAFIAALAAIIVFLLTWMTISYLVDGVFEAHIFPVAISMMLASGLLAGFAYIIVRAIELREERRQSAGK